MSSATNIALDTQPTGLLVHGTKSSRRLTHNQSIVMAKLTELGRSVGAYELLDLLRPQGVNAIATIYRTLNQLEARGLVQHIASTKCFTALGDITNNQQDMVMLVCENCNTVTPIKNKKLSKALKHNANQSDFKVHSKRLELVGICKKCQTVSTVKSTAS